jgi:TetR/AcrR family transcriptional regulator, transcriptional repressor for nem operon
MTMSTTERILDSAQALVQVRGYNGFSYADISAEVAITKASIHHHFPSKAKLAEALIDRYRQRFAAARQEVDDAAEGARERLTGYARLYAEVFTDGGRMCLCGVFAADAASLPSGVRRATAAFFDDQQRWAAAAFAEAGLSAARARDAAQVFLAALEGALLLARASTTPGADEASASRSGDGVVLGVTATMLDALL